MEIGSHFRVPLNFNYQWLLVGFFDRSSCSEPTTPGSVLHPCINNIITLCTASNAESKSQSKTGNIWTG